MLQAIGLTSTSRRGLPPAVDDLSFEARPGSVTALLGPPGSGKTTTLRLMLGLEPARGVTYFRGRLLHRIAHPAHEVGVLLGDVPGHPSRTTRGQLRMLCAASGVPASRADDLLRAVGLDGLEDQRLGTLSRGMDRRLGLAAALLTDPHALVLDEPAAGLSPRESAWLYALLRAHADQGGTVLYTTDDPKGAARNADRVVTIDGGRLVAEQDAAEFARTRLRPRVAVRTPHAARLASVVRQEARAARRSVEVVMEGGNRLSVYGSDRAEIGEAAFRHGVLLHQLADETGDGHQNGDPRRTGGTSAPPAPRRAQALRSGPPAGPGTEAERPGPRAEAESAPTWDPETRGLETPLTAPRPVRSPLRPVRYEIRRLFGVRTSLLVIAAVLVVSAAVAVLLARGGRTPLPATIAGWPGVSPLPPAALGAGLLGALSFGDEYRYPALSSGRGTVPRRLGLLLAKLAVTAATALLIAVLVVAVDLESLRLVYGGDLIPVPRNWLSLCGSWFGLSVGCAWAGLLAAGVFRATAAGVAAVLAVPVVVGPLLQKVITGPAVRSATGLPGRLRELVWFQWPHMADHWLMGALRLIAQPVGAALSLSLTALFCAYLLSGLRQRARW